MWKRIIPLALAFIFLVGQATIVFAQTEDASQQQSSVPYDRVVETGGILIEKNDDSETTTYDDAADNESVVKEETNDLNPDASTELSSSKDTTGALKNAIEMQEKAEIDVEKEEVEPSVDTENRVPDLALRIAINEKLKRNDDLEQAITIEDIMQIEDLSVYGDYLLESDEPRLQSLEGLQYAKNLESLLVGYADLSAADALAPIAGLTQLKDLSLRDSLLETPALNYLSGLLNLEYIDFDNNNIRNLDAFKPLFAAKLAAQLEFNETITPENSYSEIQLYYSGYMPMNDLSSLKDFIDFRIASDFNFESGSEEDRKMIIQYATRGIGPSVYSVYSWYDPEFSKYWSSQTILQNKLPTMAQSDIETPFVVKENIVDIHGERALFGVNESWQDDRDGESLNILHMLGMSSMLEYMETLHNGIESVGNAESIEDHFTLKKRPSSLDPDVDEYFYEGRYFNIVPYNPYATGKEDFQNPVTSEYFKQTIFYYEFKHMDAPIPRPDGNGFYPSPYITNGDTTTIAMVGFPFMRKEKAIGFNSGGAPLFHMDVKRAEAKVPYINGMVDTTIEVGEVFDPRLGVNAFDPTQDKNNLDGKTPLDITKNIILTGEVKTNIPGNYTLQYEVTSEYNLTTKGQRVITVQPESIFYEVKYITQESNVTGTPVDKNKYKPDSVVTISKEQPLRNGYNFVGWNTESDKTGASYIGGETFDIVRNTTLYAQWEKAKAPPVSSSASPESSNSAPSSNSGAGGSTGNNTANSHQTISSKSSSATVSSVSSTFPASSSSNGPTGGMNESTGNSSGSANGATGSSALGRTMTDEELAAEQARLDQLKSSQTPMGSWNVQYWSSVSLLSTALSIAVAAWLLATIVIDRKKDMELQKYKILWKAICIGIGIASIPLFVFTNDITKQMVPFTRWTVISLVLSVAQVACIAILLYFRKKQNTHEAKEDTFFK